MNYEDIVLQRTYKGIEEQIDLRVFRTLTHETPASTDMLAHRNAKLLSLLTAHLSQKGLISERELDAMLFEVAA